MLFFILKKIFTCLFSLLLIVSATFFLMKSLPGDPFVQVEILPPEVLEALYKHYGLDKPLLVQYLQYVRGIFTFDLGPSYVYQGRTVNQIIVDGFGTTAYLGLQAFFVSISLGMFLGALSTIKKNHWQETTILIATSIFLSVPNFVLASLLQYIFSMKLNLLPVARWESFAHTILPTITLATLPTAFITKLMRNSLSAVYEQDYIQTARAKGLGEKKIFFKHCLRNSLLPIIAYLSPLMAYLITGSFVCEKIFAIPGLGMWMIHSILARDYTVILGLAIFYSFILLLLQLVADIIYSLIDPRIALLESKKRIHEPV